MVGFLFVSFSTIFYPDKNDEGLSSEFDVKSVVGIVALLVSLIFQGFTFCYQEYVLGKYEIKPSQMIGFESMVGAIMTTLILLVTGFVQCPDPSFCNFADKHPIDSPPYAFHELGENYAWIYFTLMCLSIMIFNLVGLIITKYSGAVLRVILDTLRTIIIWILSIIIGFEKVNQAGKVTFEICGFLLLIAGNLIYNELLIIKCCGCDKYTRQNLQKKKDKEYESLSNTLDQDSQDDILEEKKIITTD